MGAGIKEAILRNALHLQQSKTKEMCHQIKNGFQEKMKQCFILILKPKANNKQTLAK